MLPAVMKSVTAKMTLAPLTAVWSEGKSFISAWTSSAPALARARDGALDGFRVMATMVCCLFWSMVDAILPP